MHFWYKSDSGVKPDFSLLSWRQACRRDAEGEIYPVVPSIIHKTKNWRKHRDCLSVCISESAWFSMSILIPPISPHRRKNIFALFRMICWTLPLRQLRPLNPSLTDCSRRKADVYAAAVSSLCYRFALKSYFSLVSFSMLRSNSIFTCPPLICPIYPWIWVILLI